MNSSRGRRATHALAPPLRPLRRPELNYDSIGRHDGNRVLNVSDSSYGARFAIFSGAFTSLLDLLRASRRRVFVVFVVENKRDDGDMGGNSFDDSLTRSRVVEPRRGDRGRVSSGLCKMPPRASAN